MKSATFNNKEEFYATYDPWEGISIAIKLALFASVQDLMEILKNH